VSPATATVPDTCATSGGAAGSLRRHAAPASSAAIAQRAAARTTLGRMALKDGLLAEFDHEMGTTRKLLDRLPDDKLAWKPHDRSMSLGGLATHLSNIPIWGGMIMNTTQFDLADSP